MLVITFIVVLLGFWLTYLIGYERGYRRAQVENIMLWATFAQTLSLDEQEKLAEAWDEFRKQRKAKK